MFLIIDPIFRASRLQYTMYFVEALQAHGLQAKVLCRRDYNSELYEPITKGKSFELVAELDLPEGFWFGDLPENCLWQAEQVVAELNKKEKISALWFSGFEEWRHALEKRKEEGRGMKFLKVPVGMVMYDSRFLLRKSCNVAGISRLDWLRKGLNRLIRRHRYYEDAEKKLELLNWFGKQVRSLGIGLLDERVYEKSFAKRVRLKNWYHFWLPDPCPENVLAGKPKPQRNKARILLVGLQTSRKGLREVVEAIRRNAARVENCHFILMGRLSQETEVLREDLTELRSFEFREGFFTEEEMQEAFREADYVLLPYDRSFAGSSGVLAHAAAAGVPVVSTEHGLIGYRVRKNGLGICYPYGGETEFISTLANLPKPGIGEHAMWQKNLRGYAERFSTTAHVALLEKQIKNMLCAG